MYAVMEGPKMIVLLLASLILTVHANSELSPDPMSDFGLDDYCRETLDVYSVALLTRTILDPLIIQAFNIQQTEGYLDIPQYDGFCLRVKFVVVFMFRDDYLGVFDRHAAAELRRADGIVGPYIQGVAFWAMHYNQSYLVTEPLDEEKLRRELLSRRRRGDEPSGVNVAGIMVTTDGAPESGGAPPPVGNRGAQPESGLGGVPPPSTNQDGPKPVDEGAAPPPSGNEGAPPPIKNGGAPPPVDVWGPPPTSGAGKAQPEPGGAPGADIVIPSNIPPPEVPPPDRGPTSGSEKLPEIEPSTDKIPNIEGPLPDVTLAPPPEDLGPPPDNFGILQTTEPPLQGGILEPPIPNGRPPPVGESLVTTLDTNSGLDVPIDTGSTPAPKIREKLIGFQTMVSVWPSETQFISALNLNADLLLSNVERGKILVVTYGESEHLIQFTDQLLKKLEGEFHRRTVRNYKLDKALLNIKDGPIPIPEGDATYAALKPLRKALNGVHLVFLNIEGDLRTKLEVMGMLFSKGASLESNVPWILADMTFSFQEAAMNGLYEISIIETPFYVVHINMHKTADHLVYEQNCDRPPLGVTNHGLMRVRDIILDVFRDAPMNFDREMLISRMNEFISLPLLDKYESLEVAGSPRDVLVRLVQIKPLVQVDYASCGRLRSVFSTAKNIQEYSSGNLTEMLEKAQKVSGLRQDKDYILMGLEPERPPTAVLIEDAPFVMRKPGGLAFEGIAIDIFQEVIHEMTRLGAPYQDFSFITAEEYGAKNLGKWSGVFGKMIENRRAVVGVGQISITDERKEDFDFTASFGYTSQTYIARKTKDDTLFQFTRPFNSNVWYGLISVFIGSGLYFNMLYHWDTKQKRKNKTSNGSANENRARKMTLNESLWHSYTLITQIGAPFGLVSTPARLYSVFYWFFAMVIVGCYTGNLASFLTEQGYRKDAQDLRTLLYSRPYTMLSNTSLVKGGYHSKILPDFHKALEKHGYAKNYSHGVELVLDKNYVLFGTSKVLTYYRNRDPECRMTMPDIDFYNRKFEDLAFPVKRTWEYGRIFRVAMSRIRENGRLPFIYKKWLDVTRNCIMDDDDHIRLGTEDFLGLYIILSISALAAFVVSSFFASLRYCYEECRDCHRKRKRRVEGKDSNGAERVGSNGADSNGIENAIEDEDEILGITEVQIAHPSDSVI